MNSNKRNYRVKAKKNKEQRLEQMRLLKEIVAHVAGPGTVKIVDLLYENDNVNEFNIARKLNLTINQARNVLYKLSDLGIVGFSRKKDKKEGGWYTYFWSLKIEKSFLLLQQKIINEIKNAEFHIASKKSKTFYFCKNCDIEMSEENALAHNFTCPECGEVFELRENTQVIEGLNKEVERLKKELRSIDQQIEEVQKKIEQSKQRKIKAEKRKKKAERAAKRKINAEKVKSVKKIKSVKKKPVKKRKTKRVSKNRKKPAKRRK